MRGGLVVRITPADVGRRVSVRSRLVPAPGQAATTDTVGILRSWEDGRLLIERNDGTQASVAESDLLAGKTIPDRPQRRSARYPA